MSFSIQANLLLLSLLVFLQLGRVDSLLLNSAFYSLVWPTSASIVQAETTKIEKTTIWEKRWLKDRRSKNRSKRGIICQVDANKQMCPLKLALSCLFAPLIVSSTNLLNYISWLASILFVYLSRSLSHLRRFRDQISQQVKNKYVCVVLHKMVT